VIVKEREFKWIKALFAKNAKAKKLSKRKKLLKYRLNKGVLQNMNRCFMAREMNCLILWLEILLLC